MNTTSRAIAQVAEDAIFELSVCRTALQQVYSLISLAKPTLAANSTTLRALELAETHIEMISSCAEENEGTLESRLKELAPQNSSSVGSGAETPQ
jgi:hypothetical protein